MQNGLRLVSALTLSFVFAGCGGEATNTASSRVTAECHTFCESIIVPLGCSTASKCEGDCINQFETRSPAECKDEALAVVACYAKSSSSEWTCSPGDGHVGASSLCFAEVVALTACKNPAPATTCGNNIAEGEELCDGADLKGNTCNTVVSPTSSGVLRCAVSCTFDMSTCTGG